MSDDQLEDLFGSFGAVSARRMFSGRGIYVDGTIVAIEHGGELRLKADALTALAFVAAGSTQWAYDGHRGTVMLPYWSIPDEALDDLATMGAWARLALEAGLRATGEKPRRKPKSRTSSAEVDPI